MAVASLIACILPILILTSAISTVIQVLVLLVVELAHVVAVCISIIARVTLQFIDYLFIRISRKQMLRFSFP